MESLTDFGLVFSEQEKFFFANDKELVYTYLDEEGVKQYYFADDKKRLNCLEKFLAYHSLELGNDNPTNEISLAFKNDRELYDAMIDPGNHKDKISPGSEKRTDKFTNVILKIGKNYEKVFRINTFELYAEVLLPWMVQNKYNQPMLIFLSKLQMDLLFNKGSKVDFYPTDMGLEPIIIDQEFKRNLLEKITESILKFLDTDIKEGEVLILEFKNGDRDIVSAFAGSIKYKYYQIVNLDTIKDMRYYEKIKDAKKAVLILTYIPDTENLLYYGTCIPNKTSE